MTSNKFIVAALFVMGLITLDSQAQEVTKSYSCDISYKRIDRRSGYEFQNNGPIYGEKWGEIKVLLKKDEDGNLSGVNPKWERLSIKIKSDGTFFARLNTYSSLSGFVKIEEGQSIELDSVPRKFAIAADTREVYQGMTTVRYECTAMD